jgi:hypothetical protein
MGHGRPFKLSILATAVAISLVAAGASIGAGFHPAPGEYKGGNGQHVHFKVEGNKVLDFRVGQAHFFDEAHLGNKGFAVQRHGRIVTGDWCDANHLKGYWTRQAHGTTLKIPYHAHRLHHGDEGHRCP